MLMSLKRIFLERRLQHHIAVITHLEMAKYDSEGVFRIDPVGIAEYILKNVKPDDIEPLTRSLREFVEERRMQEKLAEQRRDLVQVQLDNINKI